MYKFLFSLLFVACSFVFAEAQSVTVSPGQLTFGVVNEVTTDSQQVQITNNSGRQLTLTGYRFYTTYGSNAFRTSAGVMAIPDNSSQSIWIQFHPRHNVAHNSELIIFNDGQRGPIRVDLIGQGHYTNSYYDSTENLEEENLKSMLQSITGSGYVALGYSVGNGFVTCARDSMFMVIDNQAVNGQGATQNTIECVYTGRQIVGYTDRIQCQNTADPYYNFNTEHTFPQSLFGSAEPMRSDLFHLFPTDEGANGTRANFPFGMVSNPSWSVGGSKFANGIFEPRDVHKGEVARAMFYFVVRYQNYAGFLTSQESILRQWMTQFPVTTVESNRCNHIAGMQHNRNPFIDYPQFIERITSVSDTSRAPVVDQLDLPVDTINYGLVDATNPTVYHYWVVNKGNQPDTLTTYTLNPPTNLSFANGTAVPKIVLPGEAALIDVQLMNAPMGSFSGTLSYTVNGSAGVNTITVPIQAWASLTGISAVGGQNSAAVVFPNPVKDHLCITPAPESGTRVQLTDMEGRKILTNEFFGNGSCMEIPASIKQGVYLLETSKNNRSFRSLIIKE